MSEWFTVDRAGLGKQAEEHGKGRLIGELVQNALARAGRHADSVPGRRSFVTRPAGRSHFF
jgi:hypothetical protein